MTHWKAANVKSIGYPEIEDFIYSQEVSDKTKSNLKSVLHDFWTWMRKRKISDPRPDAGIPGDKLRAEIP